MVGCPFLRGSGSEADGHPGAAKNTANGAILGHCTPFDPPTRVQLNLLKRRRAQLWLRIRNYLAMDLNRGLALAFLGVFAVPLLSNQVSVLFRKLWPPASKWIIRHLVLPRILSGRHFINPTRAELLLYLVHWVGTILCNTYRVTSLQKAASRAAQVAVVHIVPLLAFHPLSFVSHALGLPRDAVLKVHASVGFMAAVQGMFHGILGLRNMDRETNLTVFGILIMFALAILTVLPFAKHYAYETFLYSHRSFSVMASVTLWEHLRTRRCFSQTLLMIALGVFLASSLFQYAAQTYRNITWGRHGLHCVRTAKVQQYGGSMILELRLSRPWTIQPGQYIYLSLLTLQRASIFQRHPFVVTWWKSLDGELKAKSLYIMIEPQRGWTKSMMLHPNILEGRLAWLDGPFGTTRNLGDYGTVILFASGNGVFAQLPFIKSLTDESKFSNIKTRRIKLVWLTTEYHGQLQEWMQSMLDNEKVHKDLLDISIHTPANISDSPNRAFAAESKTHRIGRRVRIISEIPDVRSYVQLEMGEPRRNVAVTVSGHRQLRHRVRAEVLRTRRDNVRLFELDYQPQYPNGKGGDIAA